MSHDIPDQNQHPTGDGIAQLNHLVGEVAPSVLVETVRTYLFNNADPADLCYFACVLRDSTAIHHNEAERIHAALIAEANRVTLEQPATVHADGYGVPVRTCSVCGDDSADQTGECADWCSPECADAGDQPMNENHPAEKARLFPEDSACHGGEGGHHGECPLCLYGPDGVVLDECEPHAAESAAYHEAASRAFFGAVSPSTQAEPTPEEMHRLGLEMDADEWLESGFAPKMQAAALRAINAEVNTGATTFPRLFLGYDSVTCPCCGSNLEFESEDGFLSEIVVFCECFGHFNLNDGVNA